MYKTKLQQLCHKIKWDLPQYSCVKDGPDHNPCFKASVVVNGVTFQTTNDSPSSKDAQNDAARLAVHHFTDFKPSGESETGRPGTEIHQAGKLQSNAKENDEYEECPAEITPPDLSSLSIGGPNLKKSNGIESYLLCNRFRVYTSIPDIEFPKGIVLLPIAEDQWVAVSLELPN